MAKARVLLIILAVVFGLALIAGCSLQSVPEGVALQQDKKQDQEKDLTEEEILRREKIGRFLDKAEKSCPKTYFLVAGEELDDLDLDELLVSSASQGEVVCMRLAYRLGARDLIVAHDAAERNGHDHAKDVANELIATEFYGSPWPCWHYSNSTLGSAKAAAD